MRTTLGAVTLLTVMLSLAHCDADSEEDNHKDPSSPRIYPLPVIFPLLPPYQGVDYLQNWVSLATVRNAVATLTSSTITVWRIYHQDDTQVYPSQWPSFFDLMLGGLRLLLSHDRGKMLSLKWSMDQFALGSIFRWNCRLRLRQCQRSGIMESESGQTGSLLRVTVTKDDFCYSWRGSTSCG